jgi:hypothetical protein
MILKLPGRVVTTLRCNMHGFKRAGGLMLGAALGYPMFGMCTGKLSFIVGTVTITIKYEHTNSKN